MHTKAVSPGSPFTSSRRWQKKRKTVSRSDLFLVVKHAHCLLPALTLCRSWWDHGWHGCVWVYMYILVYQLVWREKYKTTRMKEELHSWTWYFCFLLKMFLLRFVWLQIVDLNWYIYIYVSSTELGPLLMLMYIKFKVDAVCERTTEWIRAERGTSNACCFVIYLKINTNSCAWVMHV